MPFLSEKTIEFPSDSGAEKVLALAWCRIDTILAVSTDDGVIRFFQDGLLLENVTFKV